MIYRAPRPEDAAGLAAMADELNLHEGDPTGHFTAEVALRDVIADDAPLSCVMAEADTGLAGYALWHFGYESAWAQRGAYLVDLYVREAWRGAGVADGLLRRVARAVDAEGGTFLWWTAYAENARARAFYRRRSEEVDRIVAYAAAHERFRALLG